MGNTLLDLPPNARHPAFSFPTVAGGSWQRPGSSPSQIACCNFVSIAEIRSRFEDENRGVSLNCRAFGRGLLGVAY